MSDKKPYKREKYWLYGGHKTHEHMSPRTFGGRHQKHRYRIYRVDKQSGETDLDTDLSGYYVDNIYAMHAVRQQQIRDGESKSWTYRIMRKVRDGGWKKVVGWEDGKYDPEDKNLEPVREATRPYPVGSHIKPMEGFEDEFKWYGERHGFGHLREYEDEWNK